eukprot:g69893.t1
MGVVGVLLLSAVGWVASRQHFAQAPDKGQPNEEGNEEGSSFSVSPGLPLHLQFGFGGGPDPKPDPVVVGATEKRLPEREAFQKELKEADANCKKEKKELKEAKKELKEAEAKVEKAKKELKEAEAKVEKAEAKLEKAKKELKEAEATGTKDVIKRAKQMFDMAVKGANSALAGVDSAQAGVDSAQAGVNSAQTGVDFAQARVNNAQVLVDECILRQANMNREPAAGRALDMHLVKRRFPRSEGSSDQLPVLYVPRTVLVQETVNTITAEPKYGQKPRHLSLHFHGYRGGGKTCFLQLVAENLLEKKKLVYFFPTPYELWKFQSELILVNERLGRERQRAFLLVDESQMDPDAFYYPLRRYDHITTVAVGRVALVSSSFMFPKGYGPDKLFFSRMEVDKAIVQNLTEGMSSAKRSNFTQMLDFIFVHTKGHAYGTIKLSWECARLASAGAAAMDFQKMLADSSFIEGAFYQGLMERCFFPSSEEISLVPLVLRHTCHMPLEKDDILLDKYSITQAPPLLKRALLFKYGNKPFVDIGEASFEEIVLRALRGIDPERYNQKGGVTERALVFELALSLAKLKLLDGAPLWEPAPDVGHGRVDLFVNSRFNMMLEAVVTDARTRGTQTSQTRLLEHMRRFLVVDSSPPRYGSISSDYRILHFQKHGDSVERFMDDWEDQTKLQFHSKVLTWLLSTRKLYLGQKEILLPE